jgi:hypothetical protein
MRFPVQVMTCLEVTHQFRAEESGMARAPTHAEAFGGWFRPRTRHGTTDQRTGVCPGMGECLRRFGGLDGSST